MIEREKLTLPNSKNLNVRGNFSRTFFFFFQMLAMSSVLIYEGLFGELKISKFQVAAKVTMYLKLRRYIEI